MNRLRLLALLALTLPAPALAQSAEDRARAAASASRAKTSDSDTLLQNYVTPGLSGKPISTVDSSKQFTPNLACQKTATLLEVFVQPGSTGDLGSVRISRDTDLNGTFDASATLPVQVSGICANGVISCDAGTWNNCHSFRWAVDPNQAPRLENVAMTELAGCYCINNSCGSNLAMANLPTVLKDLGGGVVAALTTSDPRYGIAEAKVDGPVISYVGAQSTACTANPTIGQTAYRSSPTAMAGDATAASSTNSVFQMLVSSPAGTAKGIENRSCTVERRVTVLSPAIDDIISRVSGGYSTVRSGGSLDFLLGSPSDNTLSGGSCKLFDFRMTLHVGDPNRIISASLPTYFADDWGQIRIDGQLVSSGPSPWTSTGFPPGKCDLKKTSYMYPNIDLKPFLTEGDHEIWLRVAVGDHGEGYAQVHVEVDDSCRSEEQVVDQCATLAGDPQCSLQSEVADGVQTLLNGIRTGLTPVNQTRVVGNATCPITLTRDFFLKQRSYRCTFDNNAIEPDTSRGAYIIDHSTETLLADRVRGTDGSYSTTTRNFNLPDRGSVNACEAVCKTRRPQVNTAAALDGVTGAKQNDPTGWDTIYHACQDNNVCPAGDGEQLVEGCGCIDDFPEAVVMMQTVRLGGTDLVCTGTQR
ncbi:hypothetical protein PX554_06280 [Sphingomonas sp. H39-1-10]|uniref:hypothetical protein n=1 Tax=Sphingomonas pollutisoli TaxID=3030829 RepID=UPI0023B88D96|nr:hypothetical protein [Sphingomonas pollutisoli]MDF0487730.1 hypothetical protein [Sphingomonas pollutisoli]